MGKWKWKRKSKKLLWEGSGQIFRFHRLAQKLLSVIINKITLIIKQEQCTSQKPFSSFPWHTGKCQPQAFHGPSPLSPRRCGKPCACLIHRASLGHKEDTPPGRRCGARQRWRRWASKSWLLSWRSRSSNSTAWKYLVPMTASRQTPKNLVLKISPRITFLRPIPSSRAQGLLVPGIPHTQK